MKASDLRGMADAELESELETLKREILNLRCRSALGEEIKSDAVRAARRDIARILTVQNERRRGAVAAGDTGGDA